MPLDVWKFIFRVNRWRSRVPIIRCASGEPVTHDVLGTPSLSSTSSFSEQLSVGGIPNKLIADAEFEDLGHLSLKQKFVCQDAVDTVRLLRLTRKELFEEAKIRGATALVQESWKCEIYRTRKDLYEVLISYEAGIAKAPSPCPMAPVAIAEAKKIPGVMTILDVV